MKAENEFLSYFRKTAEYLGIPAAKITLAIPALDNIFEIYYYHAANAPNALHYFAGHDHNHAIRLAKRTFDLIQAQVPVPTTVSSSKVATAECMVLLFAALMLHDIGMAILPAGVSFEDLQKKQSARIEHDERSLEFIEKNLFPQKKGREAWDAFWNSYEADGWPQPCGTRILFLLARICKSHGDEWRIWLKPDSHNTYIQRTGKRGEIDFAIEFGKNWDYVREVALTASTLLSLCDLCDIDPKRFLGLPDQWESHELPESLRARGLSFIHWASHQLTGVEFNKNSIKVITNGHSESRISMYFTLATGAAADLLNWGNKPALVSAMQSYVNPGYQGISVEFGTVKNDDWEKIYEKSISGAFHECWSHSSINKHLMSSLQKFCEFDAYLTVPAWWKFNAHQLFVDLEEQPDKSANYFYLKLILKLLNQGILAEDVISIAQLKHQSQAFAPHSIDSENVPLQSFLTGFLGGLKISREIAFSTKGMVRQLRLARRGNKLFNELLQGDVISVSNTVILCEVRPPLADDLSDYVKIAERVSKVASKGIFVVFFGSHENLEMLDQSSLIARIEVKTDQEKANLLLHDENRFIVTEESGLAGNEDSIIVPTAPLPAHRSAGSVWVTLCRRGMGADKLVAQLYDSISSNRAGKQDALSKIVFFSLYDLLNISGNGMPLDQLQAEYDGVSKSLTHLELAPWSNVWNELSQSNIFTKSDEKLQIRPGFELGGLLNDICRKSSGAYLIQLCILLRFQNSGMVYSLTAAKMTSEFISDNTIAAVVKFIASEAHSKESRVNLAICLAELLGTQIKKGEIGFAEACATLNVSSSSDLQKLEDFIHFQSVFRMARACNAWEGQRLNDELLQQPIVRLGILEAIAGSAELRESYSKSACDIANAICKTIIDNAKSIAEEDSVTLMAFDICWKYAPRNNSLRDGCDCLLQYGRERDWEKVANNFHAIDAVSDDELTKEGELFLAWSKLREDFMDVLRLTPSGMQRAATDAEQS